MGFRRDPIATGDRGRRTIFWPVLRILVAESCFVFHPSQSPCAKTKTNGMNNEGSASRNESLIPNSKRIDFNRMIPLRTNDKREWTKSKEMLRSKKVRGMVSNRI
mmetsp:Transcript_7441/g.15416  ORF Transcript_7441/g.15416 Transcript_7441/m.15416 type:complete len:105 (-) Transcript_7441:148-462(-)